MANITATTKKLKIAGANGKRTDILGAFNTLQEAIDSVANGQIVPDSDSVNVKSIVQVRRVESGTKEYEWSHSLSAFVNIGRGDGSGTLANAYIYLRGTDEFVEFEKIPASAKADCLLNFAKDFTITMTIAVMDTPENGQQVKLLSNGKNAFIFTMGNGNYGFYVTDGTTNAGANTWFEFSSNNELTFVHDATAKTITYYVNGVYKAAVNISNRTNNKDGVFHIGGKVGNNLLKGGVDNVAAWDVALSSNDIQEIKDGVKLEDRTVYADAIVHCPMGEDQYPHVSDKKGGLIDGELKNGSPDDFVEITQ